MSKIINITKIKQKYLSQADFQTIETLTNALQEDELTVTCMGLYNHGKSSLLNVLVKDFDEKTFSVADVRETVKNKKVKYNQFTFVDTPGLNANRHDDKRVMDAVRESDINIFVHNVNTGEFVEKEISFFLAVKKYWKDPQEFIERTIFVLSRVDEAHSSEDIENTILRMRQQIQDIFDAQAHIIPVSSKDYKDGMIEQEQELVEISNIKSLETKLEELRNKLLVPIKKTKKQRLSDYYDTLIQQLDAKLQTKELEVNELKNEQKKINDLLQSDIQKIEKTLKQKYKMLKEVV